MSNNTPETEKEIVLIPSDGMPTKKAKKKSAQWILPGEPVAIHGMDLSAGLFYMGDHMDPPDRYIGEPSLIVPSLTVRTLPARSPEAYLDYYLSYTRLSPEQRGAYLSWIAGKRCDPNIDTGYVLLFICGLERRVLKDSTGAVQTDELLMIRSELESLIELYGDREYALIGKFAEQLCSTITIKTAKKPIYQMSPHDFMLDSHGLLPIRVAVSQAVAHGNPVPAPWALAIASMTAAMRRKLHPLRCRPELERLFAIRYAKRFGSGTKLRSTKRPLTVAYDTCNMNLQMWGGITIPNLRQVNITDTLLDKLTALTGSCIDDLARYNKWCKKETSRVGTPEAESLLPDDLVAEGANSSLATFIAMISENTDTRMRIFYGSEFLAFWTGDPSVTKLSRSSTDMLSECLERRGMFVEPDPRLGQYAISADQPVVVYRLLDTDPRVVQINAAMSNILLMLAHVLSEGQNLHDENVRHQLMEFLVSRWKCQPAEIRRIDVFLFWLASREKLPPISSRLALTVPLDAHADFLDSMVRTAAFSAPISKKAIALLCRIGKWFGATDVDIYARIHQVSAEPAKRGRDVPVLVRTGSPSPGHAIPKVQTHDHAGHAHIDTHVVRAKQAETEQVAHLLGQIFVDDEPPASAARAVQSHAIQHPSGLDNAHVELLNQLLTKPQWGGEKWTGIATKLNLMPSGAIDVINEAALDQFDEPVLDQDNATLKVNQQLGRDLLEWH